MDGRIRYGISLATVFSAAAVLWVSGCVSKAEREAALFQSVLKHQELVDSSPETVVWIENRTGELIREVGMSCKSVEPPDKSRSFGSSWTREETVEGKPIRIWSKKYPDPLVLEVLKVRFEKSGWSEYPLNHRCQLGEEVVVVIEDNGRVDVKVKE